MGISLNTLTEGCCQSLTDLEPLDLNQYKPDQSMSSVDNVVECDDKYIFKEIKKRLMYQSLYEKSLSSVDKVKDTTLILCGDDNFCNEKVKKSITIYLYCNSSTPADRILMQVFNLKKNKDKEKFVECDDLMNTLEEKGCA